MIDRHPGSRGQLTLGVTLDTPAEATVMVGVRHRRRCSRDRGERRSACDPGRRIGTCRSRDDACPVSGPIRGRTFPSPPARKVNDDGYSVRSPHHGRPRRRRERIAMVRGRRGHFPRPDRGDWRSRRRTRGAANRRPRQGRLSPDSSISTRTVISRIWRTPTPRRASCRASPPTSSGRTVSPMPRRLRSRSAISARRSAPSTAIRPASTTTGALSANSSPDTMAPPRSTSAFLPPARTGSLPRHGRRRRSPADRGRDAVACANSPPRA